MRTRPVAQVGKSKTPEDIPLQQTRRNIEQMSGVIDSFVFSPENQHQSHIDEEAKPKYPSQELRVEEKKPRIKRDKHRLGRRFISFLAVLIMAVTVMHVVTFHGDILLNTSSSGGGSGKLRDKTRYFRSRIRSLLKIKPRIIFFGDRFQPVDRKIEQYSAEYSDQTQLYHTKSSDDTLTSTKMEKKIFPNHETNKDCVPLAEWQQLAFRKFPSQTLVLVHLCNLLFSCFYSFDLHSHVQ